MAYAEQAIPRQFTGIAQAAVTVTPNDSTVIAATIGLYVGVTGNVTVTMADGNNATFLAVPVGWMPISVTKVLATGTTATDIVALYNE